MFQPSSEIRAARAARERAVNWLLNHIDSDGKPADADARTGWSRLGWCFAVAGEQSAAGAVVEWAARNRIAENGGYAPGFMEGQGYISQYANYWLGTFVISAWMAGRFDVALRSMSYLRGQQDPVLGGLPVRSAAGNHPEGIADILSTAQTGLSALVTGQLDVADKVYDWLSGLMAGQAKTGLTFHMIRKGREIWTNPSADLAWSAIVPFDKPRQAFYGPGMAAVFLAPYAHMRQRPEALTLARTFLRYNMEGAEEQFTDAESVQACKFGWAAGIMHQAEPDGGWLPWVHRMTQWFLDRQAPEGWWGPSRFADSDPTIADRMVKTSEHAMELTVLLAALGSEQAG